MVTKSIQLMGTIIQLQIMSTQGNPQQEMDWAIKQLKH